MSETSSSDSSREFLSSSAEEEASSEGVDDKPSQPDKPKTAPKKTLAGAAPKPSKPTKAKPRISSSALKPAREKAPSPKSPTIKVVERAPAPKPVRGRDKIGTFYRSGRTGKKCYYTPKDYESRMAAIDKALRHSGFD